MDHVSLFLASALEASFSLDKGGVFCCSAEPFCFARGVGCHLSAGRSLVAHAPWKSSLSGLEGFLGQSLVRMQKP